VGYRPGQITTNKEEQRVLVLQDRSRIVLDARTRLRVHFTDDVRAIDLLEGQAQFSVGKDPRRPFKVQAGENTIVALGTDFTVEYVDHQMSVSMLEGKVSAAQPASHDAVARTFQARGERACPAHSR
jgi:transmembrane sensor